MDEQVLRRLITNLKCRHCGGQYSTGNIQVLGQHKETWFVSAYCPQCQNEGLLALSVNRGHTRQPATDLTPQEVDRTSHLPPISADEVLDIHLLLRDFDGDFTAAFSRK